MKWFLWLSGSVYFLVAEINVHIKFAFGSLLVRVTAACQVILVIRLDVIRSLVFIKQMSGASNNSAV